jgi:hypothetical protein
VSADARQSVGAQAAAESLFSISRPLVGFEILAQRGNCALRISGANRGKPSAGAERVSYAE